MRVSIPWESKHSNTDERSVWTAGEDMLKITTFGQIRPLYHTQCVHFSAHPRTLYSGLKITEGHL